MQLSDGRLGEECCGMMSLLSLVSKIQKGNEKLKKHWYLLFGTLSCTDCVHSRGHYVPVTSMGVQEYSQSAAVAHFEAVQLDEEDGKVSP